MWPTARRAPPGLAVRHVDHDAALQQPRQHDQLRVPPPEGRAADAFTVARDVLPELGPHAEEGRGEFGVHLPPAERLRCQGAQAIRLGDLLSRRERHPAGPGEPHRQGTEKAPPVSGHLVHPEVLGRPAPKPGFELP